MHCLGGPIPQTGPNGGDLESTQTALEPSPRACVEKFDPTYGQIKKPLRNDSKRFGAICAELSGIADLVGQLSQCLATAFRAFSRRMVPFHRNQIHTLQATHRKTFAQFRRDLYLKHNLPKNHNRIFLSSH